jgi:hypothetical protein
MHNDIIAMLSISWNNFYVIYCYKWEAAKWLVNLIHRVFVHLINGKVFSLQIICLVNFFHILIFFISYQYFFQYSRSILLLTWTNTKYLHFGVNNLSLRCSVIVLVVIAILVKTLFQEGKHINHNSFVTYSPHNTTHIFTKLNIKKWDCS